MDKQMIEEMAKIICKDGANNGDCDKCGFHRKCSKFKVAEKLYNAGYRKIPEGAVVLMGMETEQQFEDLMVAFDEMGFMPNTTHPFPEEYVETWKQRLIFVFGQLRKETAEKFAEKIFELFPEDKNVTHIHRRTVKGICKEITEGDKQ